MTEGTFEQFSAMLDLEAIGKSSEFKRKVLPAGEYRTVPPLTRDNGVGQKSGLPYVRYRGQATAPDGSLVTINFTLFPALGPDGTYDQMFARAVQSIREAAPEVKQVESVLDFITQYPVDIKLYVKKNGEKDNGIGSLKAVRA